MDSYVETEYKNRVKLEARRDEMTFKVFYQELADEIPVRERTNSLYIEADLEKEVRDKLVDHNYNIEYIQMLDDAHLNYEKRSEDFTVETI